MVLEVEWNATIEWLRIWGALTISLTALAVSIAKPAISFFRDAKLRIVDSPVDSRTDYRGARKYLKVRVENKGEKQALNCKGTLRVIIPKNVDSKPYPTGNYYDITWGRTSDLSDLANVITVNPHDHGDLHIIFCDEWFPKWSASSKFAKIRYAQIAMLSHLQSSELREEDSFSDGDFLVELIVTWHGGNVRKCLTIHVDQDIKKSTIKLPSVMERIKMKVNRAH